MSFFSFQVERGRQARKLYAQLLEEKRIEEERIREEERRKEEERQRYSELCIKFAHVVSRVGGILDLFHLLKCYLLNVMLLVIFYGILITKKDCKGRSALKL